MKHSRFFLFPLLLVGILFFSFLTPNGLQRAQRLFLSLVAPLIHSSSSLKKHVEGVSQKWTTLDQLDEQYQLLLLENKKLSAENQLLRGVEEENKKLRQIINYREHSSFQLVPATVIARDHSTWWNTIKIDRGSNDGIAPDMPVITDSGVVGKTTVVTSNLSIVMLLTDEECNVAAKVEGTSEQGIVSGLRDSTAVLQLVFLSKLADLKEGQRVYTAGVHGGVFPSGLPIGTIKSFQARALDGQALLEPAVDLSELEEVFVIVGAK
ncbi:MAG: rod shape-determining protein MreC [Chthoniobacterales bacterium]|nr:rod shape-determining protein MreC [Chthoniobacterales bacterium]